MLAQSVQSIMGATEMRRSKVLIFKENSREFGQSLIGPTEIMQLVVRLYFCGGFCTAERYRVFPHRLQFRA